ncbi:MAG: family 20 glycosylhydrolase [Massilibacteroides sp.]|nr:family 20 glycosylhydrolase [Massilibacteroides sp.]MDD3062580.1 family 20 glycosylhydrolase [Massilibacteroides sp.]MDD4115861.1 family 20 glycosylhydrolase [Massilibacteroides sp.]MDD4660153.1 family 20 glycosylhydrolase [Massilibacteroides sp.]
MKKLIFGLLLLFLCGGLWAQSPSLIPTPESLEMFSGSFVLSSSTRINFQGNEAKENVAFLNKFLKQTCGFVLKSGSGKNSIRLISDSSFPKEGYRLTVNEDEIVLRGGEAGLFYAVNTLQQLIPNTGELKIPCLKIEDKPRFAYRGLMLDVGRYFFSVEYLKKFIDQMAHYKLNVFHWHLTEDGGWRIEIKKYPELTRKGAWRSSTQYTNEGALQDRVPHGGFYTQEEVKELVKYAAERHVEIIPEIEMPGHASAALAVFPELSCKGESLAVPLAWGVKNDIFCAGNEAVFAFLEDVLSEIIPLFPSEYIHIGGDEAPKKHWETCPKCQARIQTENLKDEHELQSYFIQRIERFVNSKGKRIIGWDEILEGGLAPNATVMSWRGEDGGIAAANMHHDVIMTPNTYLYFDYYQSDDCQNEPINIGGFLPLEKVYGYEPYTSKITKEQQKYIKGVQGNIWMEYIHSEAMVDYMTYPRALALAEIGWSQAEKKDYLDFQKRLVVRLTAMDREGVLFRIPEPLGWDKLKIENGMAVVDLVSPVEGAKIYYTTDGSNPAIKGNLYAGTLRLPLKLEGLDIKCIVTLPSGRSSGIYTLRSEK